MSTAPVFLGTRCISPLSAFANNPPLDIARAQLPTPPRIPDPPPPYTPIPIDPRLFDPAFGSDMLEGPPSLKGDSFKDGPIGNAAGDGVNAVNETAPSLEWDKGGKKVDNGTGSGENARGETPQVLVTNAD